LKITLSSGGSGGGGGGEADWPVDEGDFDDTGDRGTDCGERAASRDGGTGIGDWLVDEGDSGTDCGERDARRDGGTGIGDCLGGVQRSDDSED